MYDIDKRREMKDATVKEVMEILKELPEDAKVHFNGDNYGYIHIEADNSVISFDDSSLDDLYDEIDNAVEEVANNENFRKELREKNYRKHFEQESPIVELNKED
ncbi:MAG: hypothetical protein NC548_15770 [Lachnospiraceae bacterium]|nr:hypothetical protein [Lachnospiraceae bacterium]